MANAVGSTVTIQSLLDNTTPKGVQVLNAWVRDYPELMYVGLDLPNYFKDGGKMSKQLTYAEQKAINFKSIWALEADMAVNANEVTWYEADLYKEEAEITADVTAAAVVNVAVATAGFFKVGDMVVIKPKEWGASATQQREITAINTATGDVTLDANVTVVEFDRMIFIYNLIEYGTEIDRGVNKWDVTPLTTYFQTFGKSMEFNSNEINQTYLLETAQEFVKSKFAVAINVCNNNFAKAWYLGRNIAGAKSETQGLEAVIQEVEARDWAGSAIVDFSGIADGKAKAKKLIQTINKFAAAPIYNGNEVPTFFVNSTFITNLSEVMYDMGNTFTLQDNKIEFGLTSYSSPFFRNVQFVTSHTLDKLEPYRSRAYVFPKHLITFKTPEYQSVTDAGALVKNKVGWYQVIKMPQTSVDVVKYTAQMRIANIFAGQSFANAYGRIDDL